MEKCGVPEAFNSSRSCSVRATSGSRPADQVAITVSVPPVPAAAPSPLDLALLLAPPVLGALPFSTRMVSSPWWPYKPPAMAETHSYFQEDAVGSKQAQRHSTTEPTPPQSS